MILPFILFAQVTCVAPAAAPALDHVIIAVRDLDQAEAAFRQRGFRIKAGRQHADNLLNRHIKFQDGGEIELMTVHGPARDAMSRSYAELIERGDGGVYVALKTRSLEPVQQAAESASLQPVLSSTGSWQFLSFARTSPAGAVFFSSGDFTVQDADSIFAHRPRVLTLQAAWVEGGRELEQLLERLGARRCGTVRSADGRMAQRWALSRGRLVVVPPANPAIKRVLGVVLTSPDSSSGVINVLSNFWVQYQPAS